MFIGEINIGPSRLCRLDQSYSYKAPFHFLCQLIDALLSFFSGLCGQLHIRIIFILERDLVIFANHIGAGLRQRRTGHLLDFFWGKFCVCHACKVNQLNLQHNILHQRAFSGVIRIIMQAPAFPAELRFLNNKITDGDEITHFA